MCEGIRTCKYNLYTKIYKFTKILFNYFELIVKCIQETLKSIGPDNSDLKITKGKLKK